jgi:hypothetical protein
MVTLYFIDCMLCMESHLHSFDVYNEHEKIYGMYFTYFITIATIPTFKAVELNVVFGY